MRLEVLKLKQRKIFEELKKFPEFYLTGGTALALQIGHRISVDFDLFSEEDIPRGLLPKIKRVFKDKKIGIIVNHSEQLSVEIEGIKIDFVKYKYPLVSQLIEFEKVKIVDGALKQEGDFVMAPNKMYAQSLLDRISNR